MVPTSYRKGLIKSLCLFNNSIGIKFNSGYWTAVCNYPELRNRIRKGFIKIEAHMEKFFFVHEYIAAIMYRINCH